MSLLALLITASCWKNTFLKGSVYKNYNNVYILISIINQIFISIWFVPLLLTLSHKFVQNLMIHIVVESKKVNHHHHHKKREKKSSRL